jgi:hypothetical protein
MIRSKHWIAARWLIAGLALACQLVSAATFDAGALMNWAERSYPQLFPGPQADVTQAPYVYRCYSTGNCVGVADGVVYVYGPLSGGVLQAVGPMSTFECQAVPENCASSEPPRLSAHTVIVANRGQTVLVGRASDGRVLVMGDLPLLQPGDGNPVAGSATRVISTTAKQFMPMGGRGLLLDPVGQVQEWGNYLRWPTLANHFRPLSSAATFDWPADVLALSQGGYALKADRTVWAASGDDERLDGTYLRKKVVRVNAPADVAAFATGASPFGQHVVTRSGEVWLLGGARIVGATDVAMLDCSSKQCVGVQHDGRVIAWWADGRSYAPVTAVQGLSEIRTAAASPYGILAIDRRGQLWNSASLGGSAVAVAGFTDATDIACTSFNCAIRRSDGTLWAFGVALGALYPADPEGGVGSIFAPGRLTGFSLP